MTYPVDDAGNPRVDFVWGHMPMQPNEGRVGYNYPSGPTIHIAEGNFPWIHFDKVGSEDISATPIQTSYIAGDGGNYVYPIAVTTDHDIATTGWSNYPAFIPDYEGDGDAGLEYIVPDLRDVPYLEWQSVIEAAGFVYSSNSLTTLGATLANDNKLKEQAPNAGTPNNPGSNVTTVRYTAPTVPNLVGLADPTAAETALTGVSLVLGDTNPSTVGATSQNNLKVKSQSIAAGTKVDSGTVVDIVVYDYVVVGNPIAGMTSLKNGAWTEPFGGSWAPAAITMYLIGRTVKPAIGDVVRITGMTNDSLNQAYNVTMVGDDDGYNTGGTRVFLEGVEKAISGADGNANLNTTGLWVKIN